MSFNPLTQPSGGGFPVPETPIVQGTEDHSEYNAALSGQASERSPYRQAKDNTSSALQRSSLTPHMRNLALGTAGDLSPTGDKRRNKLGYHRISVACRHCRQRKIRCVFSSDEPTGRCVNCIRLKEECNSCPVDQNSEVPGPQTGIVEDGVTGAVTKYALFACTHPQDTLHASMSTSFAGQSFGSRESSSVVCATLPRTAPDSMPRRLGPPSARASRIPENIREDERFLEGVTEGPRKQLRRVREASIEEDESTSPPSHRSERECDSPPRSEKDSDSGYWGSADVTQNGFIRRIYDTQSSTDRSTKNLSVTTEDIEAFSKEDSSGEHEPTLSTDHRGNSLSPSSSKTSAAEGRTAQHVEDSTTQHIDRNHTMDTTLNESQRSALCESSNSVTLASKAASLAAQAPVCLHTGSTEPPVTPCIRDQLTGKGSRPSSPPNSTPQLERNLTTSSPDKDQVFSAQGEILQWVNASNDTAFVQSTSSLVGSATMSIPSSSAMPMQDLVPRISGVAFSKGLILELLGILQDDAGSEIDETAFSFHSNTNTTNSSPPATDGSEPNGTPSSSAPSNASSVEGGCKRHPPSHNRYPQREDDDEPPQKKPGREQGPFSLEISSLIPLPAQMPCPLLYSSRCQGTNSTISELLRSLQNRHRIVICVTCCKKLKVPDEEKKAENVLKKHVSEGCEPRCIGPACTNSIEDAPSHHRRTETCPSWKALANELKWTYIWTLVNPGLPPPNPKFLVGVGFEHTLKKRPSKQKQRARVNDIGTQILLDLEARERRISELESSLEAANDRNIQLQERCDKKANDLENIIQTLLECLTENHVGIRPSLQNRLRSECPKIATAISDVSTPAHPQMPHISGSTLRGQTGELPAVFPTMQADIQQLSEKSLQVYPNINPILSPQTLPSSLETFQDAPSHQTSGMWDAAYDFLNLDSGNA